MISEEVLKIIKDGFTKYYAEQKFLIIFFIAMIIIVLKEKDKVNKGFLVYYPLIMFVIVLNPIFLYYLLKVVPANVYYRFFWSIPLGVTIAYFGAQVIADSDKTSKKIIGLIMFCLLIVYCGKYVYTQDVFVQVNNWHKLPDEKLEITKEIAKANVDEKKAMVPTNLVGFVRQYDTSIKLAYQRRPYEDYEVFEIVKFYNAGDIENLVRLCKKDNVNIIVYDKAIQLSAPLQNYGFELFEESGQYDIYVLSNHENV